MRTITIVTLHLAALALPAPGATAQRLARVEPSVIHGVRLDAAPDAPEVTLVLREGRIAGILRDDGSAPAGVRRIDASGLLAVPAFLDAYTFAGCESPEPDPSPDAPPDASSDVLVEMRAAGRKGLAPAFRAVQAFALKEDALERYRGEGFAALHAVPGGNLLAGRSALVTTRKTALRERVVRPAVFQSATFAASGSGYPSTLMGYMAHLRQFFLDAARQELLLERYAAGGLERRPAYDSDLDAIQDGLRGRERFVCLAESANDIERWLALADEFDLALLFAGGREAWRLADVLAARKIPVILTLDWGKEPADPDAKAGAAKAQAARSGAGAAAPGEAAETSWEYQEPLAVRRERRRSWLEGRDCAIRLHEAGVRFAFGSGRDTPKELLSKVRRLVEAGLSAEVALQALTGTAAEILGAERHLGRIEVGHDADVALWTGPPFAKDSRLAWMFVDGAAYRIDADDGEPGGRPDEGVDATGSWELVFDSPEARPARLRLEMSHDGAVTGSFETTSQLGDLVRGDVSGRVLGRALDLEGSLTIGGFDVEIELAGRIEGQEMAGDASWRFSGGEQSSSFTARRVPDRREGSR